MNINDIRPANGKLGVMVVGCGAVATTFMTGVMMARRGLAKPIAGGVYEINEKMLIDTKNAIHKHACDLGCIIAYEIAKDIPNSKICQ